MKWENVMTILIQPQTVSTTRLKKRYNVSIARTAREVEEAQRLRYQVFFDEMGATATAKQQQRELDTDEYDADCDHLLVRDAASDMVVGCYRIMRPEIAMKRGRFYADSEFDLSRLAHIKSRTAELGRACIHPEFRSGTVIMLLWSALCRYFMENNYEFVIGCASIPLADGHDNAVAVYQQLAASHLSPAEYRVFPKVPYPLHLTSTNKSSAPDHTSARVPALLKGYTRLGAWIGGEPAWDADFNTADLFVFLPISRMSSTYAKHFMAEA
jgi:putative hemolysin